MPTYLPKTLFIGKQLIYLPSCASTNTVAYEMLLKNEAIEGCVVITDYQTAGQGQRGNTWEAEPDKNITLSLILKPNFLTTQQQFYLTMSVSLAILDMLHNVAPNIIQVKWPNDIVAGNKKLAGVLIQNSISGVNLQHSVVGIGLNVNQKIFNSPQATSLANLCHREFNLVLLIEKLLEQIEKGYLELKRNQLEKIKFAYLQVLYRYQSLHNFKIDEQIVEGQIVGIDPVGRLAVQINKDLRYFNFKEIAFL
ncbi:biotin--[acetyl-CoA-carboxylase] ligase [Adhaeribacter radiodurans]|uniref:Biotin--[acetyl-CoA-carboxylase] ligase n=1 Tax=Adhaeribacter radiodurans TaxID=2745197 RepID=A0A7L7LGE6_9BACT|nr:biotin--[acetyl-CoA-carboxylase] ligase [Adhaeribacter radiodurans]